jgi:hypothetical protein
MSVLRRNLDALLAALASIGLLITLVWPDWIEQLSGLDPDGGSGAVEWGVVAVLAVMGLVFGLRAWRVSQGRAVLPTDR